MHFILERFSSNHNRGAKKKLQPNSNKSLRRNDFTTGKGVGSLVSLHPNSRSQFDDGKSERRKRRRRKAKTFHLLSLHGSRHVFAFVQWQIHKKFYLFSPYRNDRVDCSMCATCGSCSFRVNLHLVIAVSCSNWTFSNENVSRNRTANTNRLTHSAICALLNWKIGCFRCICAVMTKSPLVRYFDNILIYYFMLCGSLS